MKPRIAYIDEVLITNKRVLVRVDFNVSLTDGISIADDFRIRQSLPTIQHLVKHHNKLILMSHLDRPKKRDAAYSLGIVAKHLGKLIPANKVVLVSDFLSVEGKTMLAEQQSKIIIMLENTRFYKGEEMSPSTSSGQALGKQLASLADVFVNDAFGSSHRQHASVVGVAQFLPSFGGLLLKKEIEYTTRLLAHSQKPFVAVIGGAKIATKLPVMGRLSKIADFLLVGGGIANTFLKAKGHEIRESLFDASEVANAKRLLAFAKQKHTRVVLPSDSVGRRNNLDIGPKTRALFSAIIKTAKTIVWSGPMGYVEDPAFRRGTDAVYEAITKNREAFSLVGGGDTIAAISKKEHLGRITHISTGGGAMLEFIEKGTLPGIEALRGRGTL